jgi:dolichol-phosphate mannosyltransferase
MEQVETAPKPQHQTAIDRIHSPLASHPSHLARQPSSLTPRILVSLCTYNECDNLGPLVDEIRRTLPAADVLVLDDNSPDGTGKLADELHEADPNVLVEHRAGKLGLGSAILAAMRYAMDHQYDLLINMDADFSHHPRYLPALLAGMENRDVMIGSRYVPGGGSAHWPLSRRLMSAGVNRLVRLLMRIPARDTSGAYRCYRVSLLRRAGLDRVISRGYSFQQEVLYRCRKANARMGESPIMFENRRAGSSKVNPREAVRSLSVILLVGLQAFFGWD